MMLAHVTILLILYGMFRDNFHLLALLLGTILPTMDLIPTLLRKETPENPIAEFHCASILHTPFFFLLAFPILLYIFNHLIVALSFSLGGVIHIIIDSFDERGRMLLYPVSRKFYGIKVLPYDFWTYLSSWKILALEGFLLAAAGASLLY